MIGRIEEKKILTEALQSKQSELIAIYGRRRVGKTYLIREHYSKQIIFSMSGLFEASLQEQINEFYKQLVTASPKKNKWQLPTNWFDAFDLLKQHITSSPNKKKVIFLDEFPWLCNAKSRFLIAFESFWNGWASARKDLVVVICGSASSWMLRNIEKSKGGLYNRVTNRIVLQPFTLLETDLLLKSKNINYNQKHVAELYMMMGGIPHYINQVRKGESPSTAINRLVFMDSGLLSQEFEHLFKSLFGEGGLHKKIVEILCKHRYGLKREALLAKLKIISSGWFTNIIDDLVTSGFVSVQAQFGNKAKEAVIKVTDNYCLFYVNFKKQNKQKTSTFKADTAEWKIWSGLAYENICLYHSKQIIARLGLSGIGTAVYQWQHKGDATMKGAQIDMLIERSDKVIHICEIKFNTNPFVVTKKYATEVKMKMASFSYFTKNNTTFFCTFITAADLVNNPEANALVDSTITLSDLFCF